VGRPRFQLVRLVCLVVPVGGLVVPVGGLVVPVGRGVGGFLFARHLRVAEYSGVADGFVGDGVFVGVFVDGQ
jgi:hypothetical protein